jgi:hypothetical protein
MVGSGGGVSSAAGCSSRFHRQAINGVNDGSMAEPPSIPFGPSAHTNTWWALLPTAEVLRAAQVGDLIDSVERAMARAKPARPFSMALDLRGEREPGVAPRPPVLNSAAHRLAARRLPAPSDDEQPKSPIFPITS